MTKTFSLIGISIVSVGIPLLLFIFAYKPNTTKNNFNRVFSPYRPTHLQTLNLKFNSFYIAGTTEATIYLGNNTVAGLLLKSDYSLSDTAYASINFKEAFTYKALKLSIDSPYFYLMDGIVPVTMWGRLSDLNSIPLRLDSLYFVESKPLSPSSLIIRTYSPIYKRYVLGKQINKQLSIFPALLEKQIDGLLCLEGKLHYDKKNSRLIYVYMHRNQYLNLDTNLNLQYKAHTIDTQVRANIKSAKVKNGQRTMLASPSYPVNKHSCVSNGLLYVHSGLLADNEDDKLFNSNSVIDVYSIEQGDYLYSFYIPNYKREKLRDFRIQNKHLVALYDEHLSTYKLNN